VGEPVELKLRSPRADTRRMMDAIAALLPPEARLRRRPTPEELALTYPPGHRPDGDTDAELQRRPGED
jgi:putative phosphoserine phosphatase/1-acylglycerol-3-phosphate O-acyltransferase